MAIQVFCVVLCGCGEGAHFNSANKQLEGALVAEERGDLANLHTKLAEAEKLEPSEFKDCAREEAAQALVLVAKDFDAVAIFQASHKGVEDAGALLAKGVSELDVERPARCASDTHVDLLALRKANKLNASARVEACAIVAREGPAPGVMEVLRKREGTSFECVPSQTGSRIPAIAVPVDPNGDGRLISCTTFAAGDESYGVAYRNELRELGVPHKISMYGDRFVAEWPGHYNFEISFDRPFIRKTLGQYPGNSLRSKVTRSHGDELTEKAYLTLKRACLTESETLGIFSEYLKYNDLPPAPDQCAKTGTC